MARRLCLGLGLAGLGWLVGGATLDAWVARTVLPPLAPAMSETVVDREGRLLRAYTVENGTWRLPVTPRAVDPGYVAQLLAWEDRRFARHRGVDWLALVRASGQALAQGRIVSGGSTLTMQVARLLEHGPSGSLPAKIRQIRLALALERRLDKQEILALYLARAPFGGNVEGVRAASLSWFGHEPARLSPAEAALLVALPQAPESRRPDRFPEAARTARDRVLARAAARGLIDARSLAAARAAPVPRARIAFPMHAPHLADRLRSRDGARHATTLDGALQARLETLVSERARALGPGLSAALIVADHATGEILAEIGSADYLDTPRRGFVDMTRAPRSPGSLLKPLIYGLAFEAGIAHPETLIDDAPMRFGSYEPQNFDRRFHGTVSLRTALQMSLNIPAVALLEAVGPAQLMARMRRAGAQPVLPHGSGPPGLAIGLGGLGLSLSDLVTLYAGIARGGTPVRLSAQPGEAGAAPGPRLLSATAAWQVADVLAGVAPPPVAAPRRIAYKTGTSYGSRDAWAIGFDGAHVIGVWIGRADAAAVPGALGAHEAAPLLFEAFGRLGAPAVALPPPPGPVLTLATAELPPPLRRFRPRNAALAPAPGPEIAYPPDGARILLAPGPDAALLIRVRDGRPPYTWLVDGRPLDTRPFDRSASWTPQGPGFVSISVIDAAGAATRARVRLDMPVTQADPACAGALRPASCTR
ncbi:penicillin-binding protein 1C [Paroceanicella profunda]